MVIRYKTSICCDIAVMDLYYSLKTLFPAP